MKHQFYSNLEFGLHYIVKNSRGKNMSSASKSLPAIPTIMYGTAWKKEATSELVELAVESGFRAIDTANQIIHYEEARVGEALKKLAGKGIGRQELFLQTKFTNVNGQDKRTPYDAAAAPAKQVKQSMESSLLHLHTDYVDSYVLHGPYYRDGLCPQDWEVWASIEDLLEEGKTRMIGVSNVSAEQLKELCSKARRKPQFVQNRCFAIRGWDKACRDICRQEGIVYQGFSLLTANAKEISQPEVRSIADRHAASAAQVIFRFAMQLGILPLTGTSNSKHMKEDLDSVRFELTADELKRIEYISC